MIHRFFSPVNALPHQLPEHAHSLATVDRQKSSGHVMEGHVRVGVNTEEEGKEGCEREERYLVVQPPVLVMP